MSRRNGNGGDNGELSPIDTLRRLFGPETVAAFQDAFGGLGIYIPETPEPSHPISEAIGHQQAMALAGECGRVHFYVAKRSASDRVAEMVAQQRTNRDIATTLRISISYVHALRTRLGIRESDLKKSPNVGVIE